MSKEISPIKKIEFALAKCLRLLLIDDAQDSDKYKEACKEYINLYSGKTEKKKKKSFS